MVRKGVRISPATGLGKEIEEFFDRQIIEQQFLQEEKDCFVDGDKKFQVAISIGGAIINKDNMETSLFERADKAMYWAKNNGRNQVVMDL